jgi:hypothetical protein
MDFCGLWLSNDRIESAVSALRGAEITQARVRFRSSALQQRSGQSRLPAARFTGQQYNLTLAALRLRPAPQKDFQFFFATDKLGKVARV